MSTSSKSTMQRVAIVTGGASGIGLATVRRFVADGLSVVICDIDRASAEQARETLMVQFPDAHILVQACNVASEPEVESAVAQTLSALGRLDIVVNNAGLMIFKPLEEHTTEDWMKTLTVDLLGAFYFIKQAFLKMSSGGSVINVSSIHAVQTTPLVTAYAAAKAATLSLTRSAAIEGKAKGIRVNAVLPGAVNTPMLRENPNVKSGLEIVQKEDTGSAEEIAQVIAFLSSREASFVQGAAMIVDGGRLCRL